MPNAYTRTTNITLSEDERAELVSMAVAFIAGSQGQLSNIEPPASVVDRIVAPDPERPYEPLNSAP